MLRTGTVSTRLMVPGCHGYRLCVKMSAVTQQCVLDTRSSGVGTRFSGPIGASAGQFLCVHWNKTENFSCMKITVNLMVGIVIKKDGHVKISFRTTREQALCLAVGKKQTIFLQQQAHCTVVGWAIERLSWKEVLPLERADQFFYFSFSILSYFFISPYTTTPQLLLMTTACLFLVLVWKFISVFTTCIFQTLFKWAICILYSFWKSHQLLLLVLDNLCKNI